MDRIYELKKKVIVDPTVGTMGTTEYLLLGHNSLNLAAPGLEAIAHALVTRGARLEEGDRIVTGTSPYIQDGRRVSPLSDGEMDSFYSAFSRLSAEARRTIAT